MKVQTESGSVYEVEPQQEGFRVRRLINGAPARDNVRATQQWRAAVNVSEPTMGQRMLIEWAVYHERSTVVVESTLTSAVTKILKDEN